MRVLSRSAGSRWGQYVAGDVLGSLRYEGGGGCRYRRQCVRVACMGAELDLTESTLVTNAVHYRHLDETQYRENVSARPRENRNVPPPRKTPSSTGTIPPPAPGPAPTNCPDIPGETTTQISTCIQAQGQPQELSPAWRSVKTRPSIPRITAELPRLPRRLRRMGNN